jgi:2-polyprenyl-3-methyl-5-hydroxy-6-metoxy-1,4-benzoquinol methylase
MPINNQFPTSILSCPLCQSLTNTIFFQDHRDYFHCSECTLVFVPKHQFISSTKEKYLYDQHQNNPNDQGYRQFLKRLYQPIIDHLPMGSEGLDFGSGPGPTLAIMFAESGYPVKNYDIFYAPDTQLLQQSYDFISASEVVEHLHQPKQELERLWTALKVGGYLGIMTKRVLSQQAFAQWHYKNDLTHVCFFSLTTFQWLANYWKADLIISGKDVVLFKKISTNVI